MIPTLLRFADAGRDEPGIDNQFSRTGRINYSCWAIRTLCETSPPDDESYKMIDGLLAASMTSSRSFVRPIPSDCSSAKRYSICRRTNSMRFCEGPLDRPDMAPGRTYG